MTVRLMLDEAGYRELVSRGHEIGHHGFAHRTPSALGAGYRRDLDRNDIYLASIVDADARNFAFPYGRSSLGARKLVGERFRSARGVEMGVNRAASDFDLLRAVQMQSHSTADGLTRWIDDVVAAPGWLIYLTHDVKDDASEYGVRPDLLDHVVSYAIAAGCEVLTVDAALDRLEIDL
jgi:peptidoglycan/xylan/chitin deacetylase (PgdA/CDA1 family)